MYLIRGARSGISDDTDLMEHDVPCRSMTLSLVSMYCGVFFKEHRTVISHKNTYVPGRAALSLSYACFPTNLIFIQLLMSQVQSQPVTLILSSLLGYLRTTRCRKRQQQKQGFTFHCVYVCMYNADKIGTSDYRAFTAEQRREREGITGRGSCGIFVPRT